MVKQGITASQKAAVEKELNAKTGEIEARLSALQDEVSTLGPALRDAVFNHPLVSVGGALLAGLAVGLLFGGRKRPADVSGLHASHRLLLDRYVDALLNEARYRVGKGQDAAEAVRDALSDRAPLIVYEPAADGASPGFLRSFVDIALKTALGFGVKIGIDYLTKKVDLEDLLDEMTTDEAAGDGMAATAPDLGGG